MHIIHSLFMGENNNNNSNNNSDNDKTPWNNLITEPRINIGEEWFCLQ